MTILVSARGSNKSDYENAEKIAISRSTLRKVNSPISGLLRMSTNGIFEARGKSSSKFANYRSATFCFVPNSERLIFIKYVHEELQCIIKHSSLKG